MTFCSKNAIEDPERRYLSRIIEWVLDAITGVPYKEAAKRGQIDTGGGGHVRMEQRDGSTSQGCQEL